jgi:hypothetical protein
MKFSLIHLIGLPFEAFQDLLAPLSEKGMPFCNDKEVEIIHDEIGELFFDPVPENIAVNSFIEAKSMPIFVSPGIDHSFDVQKIVTEIGILLNFGKKSSLPAQAQRRFILI